MYNRLLSLIFLLALLIPSTVHAQVQGPVTLASAEVDLWPEFDQPSMLVIYRLTLPSSVSLPYEMVVRIPAVAGKPNAVAGVQPDGTQFNLPYQPQTTGEWNEITFRATTPEVQIEYYDPNLVKQGSTRKFVYHWPGDYAVDSLIVQVQQPEGASNMQISPNLGPGTTAKDGLVYYTAQEGSLVAGQPFTITLSYTKETDKLSAQQLQPSAPIVDRASSWMSSVLPLLLGVLGVLLIAGGGLWYWQSGRVESYSPRRSRRRTSAQRDANGREEGGEFVYCHQCGKRASPGDRFCRTCGTQLRRE